MGYFSLASSVLRMSSKQEAVAVAAIYSLSSLLKQTMVGLPPSLRAT